MTWVYSTTSTAWSASFNRSNYVSQTFTATAGQTSFTVSGGYLPSLVEVYQNGVLLVNGADVTVTSGTVVVLAVGATAGDIVQVLGNQTFNYAATVPASKGGTGLTSVGAAGNVLTSDGTSWTSAAPAGVPTGGTILMPTTTAPTGYLKCDGSIYTRSSYSSLATMIGSPMVPSTETFRNSFTTTGGYATSNHIASVNGVAFLPGTAVANGGVNVANALRTSTDGITWTLRSAQSSYGYYPDQFAYINGTYINLTAVNAPSYTNQTIYYQTSTDLATWTARSFTTGTAGRTMPRWVVGNATKNVAVMDVPQYINCGCGSPTGNGTYYAWYSANGTAWTQCASYPTAGLYSVAAGSTSFVGLANPVSSSITAVWYSADGSTWTNVTANIQSVNANITAFTRIIWTGTYFYLYGTGVVNGVTQGFVMRSTTGASGSWSTVTAELPPNIALSPYTNTYLTDGTYHYWTYYGNNVLGYSSDLVTWKSVALSAYYAAICGTNLVGRNGTTTFSQFTITGTGYNPATQFPVPNINSLSTSTNTMYYYIKT